MKHVLALFIVAIALTGCHTGYDITTTNGMKITGVSKPRLDPQTSFYYYKDAAGQVNYIPSARVSVIEPTGSGETKTFKEVKTRKLH